MPEQEPKSAPKGQRTLSPPSKEDLQELIAIGRHNEIKKEKVLNRLLQKGVELAKEYKKEHPDQGESEQNPQDIFPIVRNAGRSGKTLDELLAEGYEFRRKFVEKVGTLRIHPGDPKNQIFCR